MKILHVGKYYPPFAGGLENFVSDLISTHQAGGIRSEILVHQHPSSQHISLEENVQLGIERVPTYGTILYAPVSPYFPFALSRKIKLFRPDIIHLHLPNTSAFYWLKCSF